MSDAFWSVIVKANLIFLFIFLFTHYRYSAASVIDTSSKYKFLWKLPLEDIELVKGKMSDAMNWFTEV